MRASVAAHTDIARRGHTLHRERRHNAHQYRTDWSHLTETSEYASEHATRSHPDQGRNDEWTRLPFVGDIVASRAQHLGELVRIVQGSAQHSQDGGQCPIHRGNPTDGAAPIGAPRRVRGRIVTWWLRTRLRAMTARTTRTLAVLTGFAFAVSGCAANSTPTSAQHTSTTGFEAKSTTTVHIDDTLPARLDNGAQGRDTYHRSDFVPPAKTCGGRLDGSNLSHVLRVLPKGPVAPNGKLAFTSGVCVYVPAGYERSTWRYPTIYLLHGGGGDAGDMVSQGHVDAAMDHLVAGDQRRAAILVMPDGDDGRWFDQTNGTLRNETYIINSVIPYVDRHFRTIATRQGRAIDGISNGGLGAMMLAAKHPELFIAAGSLSGNLAGLTLTAGSSGVGPGAGMSESDEPIRHVSELAHTDLVIDIGSRCDDPRAAAMCFTKGVDLAFLSANRAFESAATAIKSHVVDYRENVGAHAWRYWSPLLAIRHLPFLLARLQDPTLQG